MLEACSTVAPVHGRLPGYLLQTMKQSVSCLKFDILSEHHAPVLAPDVITLSYFRRCMPSAVR